VRSAIGYILLSALPLVAAPVPKEVRAGDDQRIVGVWTLTKAKYGEGDFDSAVGTKWTLGADGKAIRDRPNEGVGKAKFLIDPTVAVKTFEWITDEGNTFVGVYELDGDRFNVVLVVKGRDRPTACQPTEGGYYFEFKREK
jgi:uncharacterized protein (TIGR03067 family)